MRSKWHPYPVFLVACMAVGSALMWIGVPVGLVYAASRLADSPQPSLGPYLLILFGLPTGMALIGIGLGRLDGHYGQVTGTAPTSPQRSTWLKSMRAERESTSRQSVLTVVMVWSVCACLTLMGVWFLFFAGSSLPNQ